jgi:hypothetical protein
MASYIGGVYTGGTTDEAGLSTGEQQDRFQPGFRPAVSDTTDRDRELAALQGNVGGASTVKNYYDLTSSVAAGEILIFGGGTFDPEALNRPEFLNAIIQTAPRIEYGRTAREKSSTQGWASSSSRYRDEVRGKGDLVPDSEIGEVIRARMDAFANALVSAAPTGAEGQKAVKEFYRLASADITSKGLGSLSVAMRDENGMQTGKERLSDSVVMSMSPAGIAKRSKDYAMDPNSFNADIDVQVRYASGGESQEIADDLGRKAGTFGPETVVTDTTGGTNFDPRMTNTLDTEGEGGGFSAFGSSNAGGLFRPQDRSPEVKKILDDLGAVTGNAKPSWVVPPTGGDPSSVTGTGTGAGDAGGMIDIQSIIATFKERFGMDATVKVPQLNAEGMVVINPTTGQPVMVDAPNPLLEQLLDLASVQNGFVSAQQIQVSQAEASVKMEVLRKESAIAVANANGASDEAISRIETASDLAIASAQQVADKYISQNNLTGVQAQARAVIDSATATATGAVSVADIQSAADQAIAQLQANVGMDANAKDQAIAEIQAAAEKDIATIQTGGQVDAATLGANAQTQVATTQAGAQLGSAQASAGAASPFGFLQQGGTSSQLEQIFAGQNAVGMAQANPYGQTAADRQRLQETQFNPYALTNAQGYGLGQAQAANNPYAATQLGQDSARIDQILRGGLSAEQRIAEINAGQSGQNQANFLNFIGNPSAVGFATESGLFSPGQGLNAGAGSNILQDISNAEAGNIPGSLFGFNPPTAAGAGGGTTQNVSGTGGNFNANTLRNASDEQIGFLQGAAAAGGQTQSEFQDSVQAFTPQGV